MRWLTGWCTGSGAPAHEALGRVEPIAARPLWTGPDPLWAVGDWRPGEIRLVTLRPGAPAVVGTGPAATDQVAGRRALGGARAAAVADQVLHPGLARAVRG
ncbi:asparagine synthase, partial [Kitasatospora sp. NPDC004799]